jgi:hypothetical protein
MFPFTIWAVEPPARISTLATSSIYEGEIDFPARRKMPFFQVKKSEQKPGHGIRTDVA